MTAAPPVLRLATPADGDAIAAIYAPYVNETAISFELTPPTGEEMSARIAKVLEHGPYIVAELDGVVRAYAYAGRFRDRAAYDWTAESTVYVDRSLHRTGLGRATMEAVLRVLRLQGFRVVVAGVTPPNRASVGLHQALGFERVGTFDGVGWKDGRWHGVEFFELELLPAADGREPAPIRPLPDLVGTPELARAIRGEG
ncbi:MAG TPA: GNAT family N-acetyltransferase [Candidatus Limnocylindrales bacterium]